MREIAFITATGTGIGKTFLTASLAAQARKAGQSVMAYKPVISGFNEAKPADSDTGIILQALNLPITPQNIERLSPWRFKEPQAPSIAARAESRALDFEALVTFTLKTLRGPEDLILIEGVGGVMAPLDDNHTVLDWIERAGTPAILVAGNYLGTISHTLTAYEVMKQRGLPIAKIIVNEAKDANAPIEKTISEMKLLIKDSRVSVQVFPSARVK